MYNDRDIRIDHSPITAYSLFNVNQVGTDVLHDIPAAPSTVDSTNSILFSGDITLASAISATTEAKPYTLITSGGVYYEDLSGMVPDNLEGVYASGSLDVDLCFRTLDYTPSNSNTVYVDSDDGNDTTGSGTVELPYATITKATTACTVNKTKIMINNSATYEEAGIHFSGNVKGLYANEGQTPTFIPIVNSGIVDYTEGELISGPTIVAAGTAGTIKAVQMGEFFYRIYSKPDAPYGIFWDSVNTDTGADISTGNLLVSSAIYLEPLKMSNGNILLLYMTEGAGTLYYKIFSPLMVLITDQTVIDTTVSSQAWPARNLNNGNVAIFYSHSGTGNTYLHLKILQPDGTVVFTSGHLDLGVSYIRDVEVLEGGNIVIAWEHYASGYDYMYIAIYDEDGTQVLAPTNLATSQWGARIAPLANGNWFLAYIRYAPSELLAFRIYGPTGTAIVGETTIATGDEVLNDYVFGARRLPTNAVIITYSGADNYDNYYIYSESGVQLKGKTRMSYSVNGVQFNAIYLLDNNNIAYFSKDRTSDDYSQYILSPYTFPGVKVSTDAVIHGVTIDADDATLLNKIISLNSADLSLKFSRLLNATNPGGIGDVIGYAIKGTGDVTVNNSVIASCGGGISVTSNASTIRDTQIYWCTDDYGIYINGAAASLGDITINHCDLFANYGGIHLENNNGTNEVIKNNIIHSNANYGIDAETTVTISHTVTTDAMTGVIEGDSVFHSNPAYIDEGTSDPDDLDLNIKTKLNGYDIDSTAKGLADDDRNAGSIDVQYLTASTTWTSMTLEKPKQIDRWLEPVGEVKTERKDGSVRTSMEAITEYMNLDYEGMLNADYAKVLRLFASTSSQVRIYEDPTTYPNDYGIWRLVYSKLGKGAKHYKLTRTGVQGVSLTFARAYELED